MTQEMITIKNNANGRTYPIAKDLWEKKKGKFGNAFSEVAKAPTPPEVKALKNKQAQTPAGPGTVTTGAKSDAQQ